MLRKTDNNAQNKVSSVIENQENFSPGTRGSGSEEVAETTAPVEAQLKTQTPLQKDSHQTCAQIREASAQWKMTQNLGVTCEEGDATVVTKFMKMEVTDKEEANKLGNRRPG